VRPHLVVFLTPFINEVEAQKGKKISEEELDKIHREAKK